MVAEGLGNSEIAARLNTRGDVVSEWRKRFFLERLSGLFHASNLLGFHSRNASVRDGIPWC